MRKIIGIMAAKGAGKTTAAKVFKDHGFRRVSIATPIKDMCKVLGLTNEHLYGKLKETPSDLLMGQTPRRVMQTLGVDYAQRYIHPDIWISIALRKISSCSDNIVIDDVRFPHEVAAIKALGGEIWIIRRPSVEPPVPTLWQKLLAKIGIGTVPHISELHWRDYVDSCDQLILNTESQEDFQLAIHLRLTHRTHREAA